MIRSFNTIQNQYPLFSSHKQETEAIGNEEDRKSTSEESPQVDDTGN